MKFPNPCCQCGFCCLITQCPIGGAFYGKHKICPGLSFDEMGLAACNLAGLVPVGDGCCISARAFKEGKAYDYAGLPRENKHWIVNQYRERT